MIALAERGWLPDRLLRFALRRLFRRRIRAWERQAAREPSAARERAVRALRDAAPGAAGGAPAGQAPVAFFRAMLGPRLKFSSGHWGRLPETLAEAEAEALRLTAEHAGLADGQEILDLGCGWGALSLWAAERWPGARIVALTDADAERRHVEAEARRLGLGNVEVVCADWAAYAPGRRFDRVVAVELFERVRAWRRLTGRIADWLAPDGRAFVHLFCHRRYPSLLDGRDRFGRLARRLVAGGLMPSDDLLERFDERLRVTRRWRWSGEHYQKTAEAWLARLDAERPAALAALAEGHGAERANRILARWRILLMACAELFGLERGQEWWIAHYLLEPSPDEGESP